MGSPRPVRKQRRRPGPPPWSRPPSVARALATHYTTAARKRFNVPAQKFRPTSNRWSSAVERQTSRSQRRVSTATHPHDPWGGSGSCRRADRSRGCRRHWSAGPGVRNCAVWMTISAARPTTRTFRHAPNTSDHHRYGQSVECVTDRGLCRCWPQRGWLLRGTVRRLEPNNVVGEEPQGGDEPCVVVCVASRSPRSR